MVTGSRDRLIKVGGQLNWYRHDVVFILLSLVQLYDLGSLSVDTTTPVSQVMEKYGHMYMQA